MKTISFLTVIIYGLIISGCNQTNPQSLIGKKLYLINHGKNRGAGELKLNFETDDHVKLTLTCLYYSPKVKPVTGTQLVYLKKILSAVNGSYPYTFKDNVLTIPNTNFVNLRLTYKNGFYTDSGGQLYNSESILDLPEKEKIERLRQSNPELVIDNHLPNVMLLDSVK